jgi:hypothetical protein
MSGSPLAIGERRLVGAAAGLTVLATIALYWPALGAGFVGDDFMILHRLRGLGHAADVVRFFRGEFFEYYRPLAFVSHAIDWAIAGQNARQFHLTNLLIHIVNTVLVLLIGRRLSLRPLAGLLAAALFALHASNNEAVVWMSARFDLLATCFGLGALYCMMRGGVISQLAAIVLFFFALLCKESAVALPIAAAGWSTFRLRATSRQTAIFMVPWLATLAVYSALRHLAGGVSAVGGAARIPKLAAFIICLVFAVALASERWTRLRRWLTVRRGVCAVAMFGMVAVVPMAALSAGKIGELAREKLSVAGFVILYLISPVLAPGEALFGDPAASGGWVFGACALLLATTALIILWRRLLDDDRYWLLAAFLLATLLPISALTEGKRYLYLPSCAASLSVAIFAVELHGRARRFAMSAVAAVLAVSTVQIVVKIRDWEWAGRMTQEGAQLVDAALAPSCGTGHVVFLTGPVGIRGVYSNFYYETFEVPRGCMPESFQVVVRVVRVDTPVMVRWSGPDQISITAPEYAENFLLSRDLRGFDTLLRFDRSVTLETPVGAIDAFASNGSARVVLRLAPDAQRQPIQFFYYSNGRIQSLERP